MTDLINSLTVVLEKDMREDDVETLIIAIQQLRWVLSVESNISDNLNSYVENMRIKRELWDKIRDIIYPRPT